MALAGQYSDDDLSLICGYMDSGVGANGAADDRCDRGPPAAGDSGHWQFVSLDHQYAHRARTVDPVNQDLHDIGDATRAGDQRRRAGGFCGLGSTKEKPVETGENAARNDGDVLWWRQRDHARLFGARWRHHRFPCPRGVSRCGHSDARCGGIAREVRRDPLMASINPRVDMHFPITAVKRPLPGTWTPARGTAPSRRMRRAKWSGP